MRTPVRVTLAIAAGLIACGPKPAPPRAPVAAAETSTETTPAWTAPAPWQGVRVVAVEPGVPFVRVEAPAFGDDLLVPRSSAFELMSEGPVIVMTRTFLAVGDTKVASVEGGVIARADVHEHRVKGMFAPLDAEATRREDAARARDKTWDGNAVLLLDQDTRFSAILELIYTANQRGYHSYEIAIDPGEDSPLGLALTVRPPRLFAPGEERVIEAPPVAIQILEDRLILRDENDTTTLDFDENDAADREALLVWASTRAKALEGRVRGFPQVNYSARSAVTAQRFVTVMSIVSGPTCGPEEHMKRDRTRCFFANRVIETDGDASIREDTNARPAVANAAAKGTLDKEQIRTVVRSHIDDVSACYNQGLARDPTLHGRVTVKFTINGQGAVSAAVPLDDVFPDPAVVKCMLATMKGWVFPKPEGGGNVVVTYPFMLETAPPAAPSK